MATQYEFYKCPQQVKDFLIEKIEEEGFIDLDKQFDRSFEGVYDSLEDWMRTRVSEDEVEEAVESIGETIEGCPFYFDYVVVDGKYWCFGFC